ncbi:MULTISPECIES: hypothetical protein [Chryseobacterium]|uniref:hypothetical protein n=1 Tax=Chryseobacterium sp. R2A-55 TaxID=2744445 RepID=UPI001F1AC258|nr:hypothetical protein [Chryseobacterium sp. R2A-55]
MGINKIEGKEIRSTTKRSKKTGESKTDRRIEIENDQIVPQRSKSSGKHWLFIILI